MKYSLRKRKNKNLFKRHKYRSTNALNIKYFGPLPTTVGLFWVSLNYPILNIKKMRCLKNVWMRHCTNKVIKGAKKARRNLPSCFFISCFTVSVTPSIGTPESSNDFVILILSFISLFEINKVNPFPALTAPFPHIFLSNLFIAFEVKLLTNPDKLSLANGLAIFVSAFFPKLPSQKPKESPD